MNMEGNIFKFPGSPCTVWFFFLAATHTHMETTKADRAPWRAHRGPPCKSEPVTLSLQSTSKSSAQTDLNETLDHPLLESSQNKCTNSPCLRCQGSPSKMGPRGKGKFGPSHKTHTQTDLETLAYCLPSHSETSGHLPPEFYFESLVQG